jgi:hypothetical protein
MRPFRDKNGKISIEYMIAIAIGLIILFVIGYSIVVKKSGGILSRAIPICNTDWQRCACFYHDGCPSQTTGRIYDTEICPPDEVKCDMKAKAVKEGFFSKKLTGDPGNINFELQEAKKAKRGYGTCCQGKLKDVSHVAYKTYDRDAVATTLT